MKKIIALTLLCLVLGPDVSARPRKPRTSLAGSHDSLAWQGEIARQDNLPFIIDDDVFVARVKAGKIKVLPNNRCKVFDSKMNVALWSRAVPISRLKAQGWLQRLPNNGSSIVDTRLDAEWRWAAPQVIRFLNGFGAKASAPKAAGKPLKATSAMRTPRKQAQLQNGNRNATGVESSAHLRGATIDIAKMDRVLKEVTLKAKKGQKPKKVWAWVRVPRYTPEQIKWLRTELLKLERRGLVEVTEEYNQAVFHITVREFYR